MKHACSQNRKQLAPAHLRTGLLFVLTFLVIQNSLAQTVTTTPRAPRAIRHSTLGTWSNFNPLALSADDNNYIEYKFVPSWSSSDRLVCFDFDFSDIPDNAIIDKLFLKIIRFKKGKSEVIDNGVYFSKYGGDRVMEPNLRKPDYWPASEAAAYYELPGSGPGDGYTYGPYTYTAADIKNRDFNVYITAYRIGNNNNFYIYFEQIAVGIQYTIPTVTATLQPTRQKEITWELQQANRNVYFKGREQGPYQLTVTDLNGNVLQKTLFNNTGEQTIPLNERCKGYCIITVERNGKRKSVKTFVQ